MEKNMNKVEEIEINEEVKAEELTEETLDEVDGGIALATCYMALNCAMVMMAGKPLWLLATM